MNGYRLAADGVLLLHLAFVLFVIAGSFLAWQWRTVARWHLPALLWGLWIEFSGQVCPLTPLENRLRELAGQAGYSGGFVEHYLVPLLYPPGLTPEHQWLLGAVLIIVNVAGYYGVWRRSR